MSGCSKMAARGLSLPVAAVALALLLSACGSSSKSTSSPNSSSAPGTSASGGSPSTTSGSGAAASAQVDLTVAGALTFHITGTKAGCNGLGDGVDLAVQDYPEVGTDLSIANFNGHAEFKWLYKDRIYTNTSTTSGVTLTTKPFKVVLKSVKLVTGAPAGAPPPPGVTLNGTIACPG